MHIAIIPDGNRRWAKTKGKLPWEGHLEGITRFNEVSDAAFGAGVVFVTFWAGSKDNLMKRTSQEVSFLVQFLIDHLKKELASDRMMKKRIRFRLIGQWHDILKNTELKRVADELMQKTAGNTQHNLTILFGYDGKEEMMMAIPRLANTKLDYDTVRQILWTGELPPVDLVIRTGGEPHWSAGFMMWHTTDSQFYFTNILWPEFTSSELDKALEDFAVRERRLGK